MLQSHYFPLYHQFSRNQVNFLDNKEKFKKKKKKKGMEWLFDKIKMIFYSLFQYFLRGNILRSKRRRKTQNLYVLDVRMSMTGVVIFT